MRSIATTSCSIARSDAVSPLPMSHQLLSLAENARRTGHLEQAARLLRLVYIARDQRQRGR